MRLCVRLEGRQHGLHIYSERSSLLANRGDHFAHHVRNRGEHALLPAELPL
jgi:hypothetical protein